MAGGDPMKVLGRYRPYGWLAAVGVILAVR